MNQSKGGNKEVGLRNKRKLRTYNKGKISARTGDDGSLVSNRVVPPAKELSAARNNTNSASKPHSKTQQAKTAELANSNVARLQSSDQTCVGLFVFLGESLGPSSSPLDTQLFVSFIRGSSNKANLFMGNARSDVNDLHGIVGGVLLGTSGGSLSTTNELGAHTSSNGAERVVHPHNSSRVLFGARCAKKKARLALRGGVGNAVFSGISSCQSSLSS